MAATALRLIFEAVLFILLKNFIFSKFAEL